MYFYDRQFRMRPAVHHNTSFGGLDPEAASQ
jgi:hypothetical protein